MRDLQNTRVIWFKGWLFLFLGLASGALVFFEAPSWRMALLLAIAIWGFCRAYYFAFYVIQHYVDSTHRFSGLLSFLCYALRKKTKR